jgi:hypothetical protein
MIWVFFSVDQELSFISHSSIANNLFNYSLRFTFDLDKLSSAVALAEEHIIIRRGIFLEVLSGDPRVNMLYAIVKAKFIVAIIIRSFKNIKWS